ncbi:hypothetical protein H5410_037002 [Solanum commersonii]|uniref:DUF4283 domain-containing protein n=1 Tax=Solanum commersonii TaxID=4109 RepID=A0A9J5Y6T6_SOLCO|nr:hypothetical protein H5410_037002 [Solanum commersonii]
MTPTATNISIGNYEATISPNKGNSNPSLPKEVSFASLINPFRAYHTSDCITQREVSIKEEVPYIRWTEEEVGRMNKIENLQFAVIGKFSYEWSDLEELRRSIPQQCGIKGGCQIGLFRNRHILICLNLHKDFINLISKGAFYIICKDGYSYLMRTLIYDDKFKISEETTKTVAWISLPNLIPTFFVKKCLYSLAFVVGSPVHLDLATINKTRPSCARVKVLVDLKGTIPKAVQMDIENEARADIQSEIVLIKYDYLPEYCSGCKMQGNDMEACLLLRQSKVKEICREQRMAAIPMPKMHPFQNGKARILSSGKVVGDSSSKNNHKSTESYVPLTENELAIVNKVDEHNSESESSSNQLMTDKEIKEIENVKKASNNNSSQSQKLIMNASEEFISLTDKVSYTNQYLAIMEVPTAIQTDDSQVIMVKLESPNKILHGIISHKKGEHSKDEEQQITVEPKQQSQVQRFYVTIVYAKCDASMRMSLWEDLYQINMGLSIPWLIGGDFNVVFNEEEKIGGLLVQEAEHKDFDDCIAACD